ncbi:amidohydrolase [Bordetella genomosp. 9]|uniref:amidohydrolase family protein n=1 Tax=Bordetella genomosp. 9 TaxID=1416803 RepID=UPI000A290282|nr:amidohydrolase family protein [Bordetella genomosp. 9]ARP89894.1 amidohydrolase [Bordetella genomosp. 9]
MTKPCLPPLSEISAVREPVPPGACDSHAHVFGPYREFPLADDRSYTPPENGPGRFIAHLDRLGLSRGVLVTASAQGDDNRNVLAALRAYPDRLRAVVVVRADISDAELDSLAEQGVRGARFNLYKHGGKAVYRNGVGLEDFIALAPRLKARGWHAQIWIHAPDLPELAPALLAPGVELVVDHMGRMNASRGVEDPGFRFLCKLLAEGKAWTKISGADRNTAQGSPFADIAPFATALLQANAERVVWGTDWPHINYYEAPQVPDDGLLLNLLTEWMPDAATRAKVLVDNPARLYGFAKL